MHLMSSDDRRLTNDVLINIPLQQTFTYTNTTYYLPTTIALLHYDYYSTITTITTDSETTVNNV